MTTFWQPQYASRVKEILIKNGKTICMNQNTGFRLISIYMYYGLILYNLAALGVLSVLI